MRAQAFAKINLALVVGPHRADGKHEVCTVLQRVHVHDVITLEPSDGLVVEGFAEDTIVGAALEAIAEAARVDANWRVRIDKEIPVAAGLGGGSSDAASALQLANGTLDEPLPLDDLDRLAARLGADVPFFLHEGAQLATADGTELAGIELPTDYSVVLVAPHGLVKKSTASVYEAFDARRGADGFADRAAELQRALASIASAPDLAALPPNDLATSSIARELEAVGAFRADVSGAGPTVYGLFEHEVDAARAASALAHAGSVIVTRPVEAADHR